MSKNTRPKENFCFTHIAQKRIDKGKLLFHSQCPKTQGPKNIIVFKLAYKDSKRKIIFFIHKDKIQGLRKTIFFKINVQECKEQCKG